jgi:hypothetical protein
MKQKGKKKNRLINKAANLIGASRPPQSNDRLAEDKMYLSILSGRLGQRTDIFIDKVTIDIEQFLAASTECSAGINDHFVVGVGVGSIFSPVRWKATRWR